MRRAISVVLILTVISISVILNLQGTPGPFSGGDRTVMPSQRMSDEEMANTVGGMRFLCFLMVAGAGALAATGPGLVAAFIAAGFLVCECDKEFDKIFATHFVEICHPSAN